MQEDKHECELVESDISIHSSGPNKFSFLNQFWLKLRIVSERTAVYHYYYNSRAAIKLEKKRQIELNKPLLIHPFSHLRYFMRMYYYIIVQKCICMFVCIVYIYIYRFLWETFMIFIYMGSLLIIPFEACNIFFSKLNPDNFMPTFGPIMLLMHFIFIVDIFLHFITGFEDPIVKKINLNSSAIAKYVAHYAHLIREQIK